MKLNFTIAGNTTNSSYPLSAISDALYALLDKLNEMESRYSAEELSSRLPFIFAIREDGALLGVKIEKDSDGN